MDTAGDFWLWATSYDPSEIILKTFTPGKDFSSSTGKARRIACSIVRSQSRVIKI
ncbi:MAG: hypothetical protein WA974_07725 [Thermodesulfobacteriota bacterium]